jgi:hypothetical protein
MNDKKLNRLFQAARHITPPLLSATLADDVVLAIRREAQPVPVGRPGLFDELNAGFSRLAALTAAIMLLGLIANVALGSLDLTDLGDGAVQVSAQWLVLPAGV